MKISALLSIATLLALLLQSAGAEESYRMRFQLIKSSAPPAKRILSKSDWSRFTDKSENISLGELAEVAEVGASVYLQSGMKNPLPYRDPRPEMFQVQYVDFGLKIDFVAKRNKGGLFKLISRGEYSSEAPLPELPERASVVIFESSTLVKRGQVAIFGGFSGPLALKYLRTQFPNTTFNANDSLLLAVTIE